MPHQHACTTCVPRACATLQRSLRAPRPHRPSPTPSPPRLDSAPHSISQKLFLNAALLAKKPRAAVEFVRKLPERFRDVRTYNMALQVRACVRVRVRTGKIGR
jgi:hypothetical protein